MYIYASICNYYPTSYLLFNDLYNVIIGFAVAVGYITNATKLGTYVRNYLAMSYHLRRYYVFLSRIINPLHIIPTYSFIHVILNLYPSQRLSNKVSYAGSL